MRTALLAAALLLLAGCLDQAGSAADPPVEHASNTALQVVFGCAAEEPSTTPCLQRWEEGLDVPVAIVPDRAQADRVAVLLWVPETFGAEDPTPETGVMRTGRTAVAVSTDHGDTWSRHLVGGGIDLAAPNGALYDPTGIWTAEGLLVVAGYLEDTPYVGSDGSGVSGGTTGQVWVGWSADEGATWTNALLARPHWGSSTSIEELAPGHLAAAWVTPDQSLATSESRDGGRTWSEPLVAAECQLARVVGATAQGYRIGCDGRNAGFAEGVRIYEVLTQNRTIEERGEITLRHDFDCAMAGPVADAGGTLWVAHSCTSIQLWRSEDGGTTWHEVGDAAEMPLPSDGTQEIHLAMGDGFLVVAGEHYATTPLVVGREMVQLAAWSLDGRLLSNEAHIGLDPDQPGSITAFANTYGRTSLAAGPKDLWFTFRLDDALVGWLHTRPA